MTPKRLLQPLTLGEEVPPYTHSGVLDQVEDLQPGVPEVESETPTPVQMEKGLTRGRVVTVGGDHVRFLLWVCSRMKEA